MRNRHEFLQFFDGHYRSLSQDAPWRCGWPPYRPYARKTQKSYVDAVRNLAKHYMRSADLLTEEDRQGGKPAKSTKKRQILSSSLLNYPHKARIIGPPEDKTRIKTPNSSCSGAKTVSSTGLYLPRHSDLFVYDQGMLSSSFKDYYFRDMKDARFDMTMLSGGTITINADKGNNAGTVTITDLPLQESKHFYSLLQQIEKIWWEKTGA